MEKWIEVNKNEIPKDVYTIELTNGEENGLNISLIGEKNNNNVRIFFGVVHSVRMFDEGIVQDLYSDAETERLKKDEFKNVIYEIKGGEYLKSVCEISQGFVDQDRAKHYVVVTLNYFIEVITDFKPEITVKPQ